MEGNANNSKALLQNQQNHNFKPFLERFEILFLYPIFWWTDRGQQQKLLLKTFIISCLRTGSVASTRKDHSLEVGFLSVRPSNYGITVESLLSYFLISLVILYSFEIQKYTQAIERQHQALRVLQEISTPALLSG